MIMIISLNNYSGQNHLFDYKLNCGIDKNSNCALAMPQ